MHSPALARGAHLAGRRMLTEAVGRLPLDAATLLRRPVAPEDAKVRRAQRALLGLLRRGGIPAAVDDFGLVDNPGLRFVSAESLVLQQLYWLGEQGWEPELLPWWRLLSAQSTSVVELGSNIGYYAVQAAKAPPRCRYVAVEPHPASARICRANLALNDVTSVEVVEAAAVADDHIGRSRILVPWEQLRTPTVAFLPDDSELPATMRCRGTAAIDVRAVPVRSLLAEDVDLIKLDVEGQEHVLLAACEEYLRARTPTLLVEVLVGTAKLRAILVELCQGIGYRCLVPGPRALTPLDARELPDVDLPEHGTHDLIVLHPASPHAQIMPVASGRA